jgi:hypothetical protein
VDEFELQALANSGPEPKSLQRRGEDRQLWLVRTPEPTFSFSTDESAWAGPFDSLEAIERYLRGESVQGVPPKDFGSPAADSATPPRASPEPTRQPAGRPARSKTFSPRPPSAAGRERRP